MKRVQARVSIGKVWTALSSLLIAGLGIFLVLFTGLDSHIAGYSPAEVQAAREVHSLTSIVENPVNAPHKVVTWAFTKLTVDPVFAGRLASATFATFALLLFYVATRMWHGKRVAFLATLLLGTGSWFLLTARSSDPNFSASVAVTLLALSGYWMSLHFRTVWSYVAVVASLALMVYVPGMVWLVLLGLILRGRSIFQAMTRNLQTWKLMTLIGLLLLFVIAPIAYAGARDMTVLLALLGAPEQLPHWSEVPQNLGWGLLGLFGWQHTPLAFSVGQLPLMDVVTTVLALLGLVYYATKLSLDRTRLLIGVLLLGLMLLSIGSLAGYAYLLPVMYFLAAGGMAYLLMRWLEVFPRNPLARGIGIVLLTLVIGFAVFYNLRAYFIAAPHTDNIRQIYSGSTEDLIQ
jgi:hypothetical protein